MRKLLTALALAFVLSAWAAASGQTPAPANNVLGDVLTVDAASKQIYVKTDAGAVVIVTVSDAKRILKNPPGESKLEQFNGDYVKAEMVKAFLSSTEYRDRFRQR